MGDAIVPARGFRDVLPAEKTKREAVLASIRSDPKITINRDAMDAVVLQVNPAVFSLPMVPLAPKAPPAN